jgi:hypothetical protein
VRVLVLAAALGLALGACQGAAPQLPSSAGPLTARLRAEGDALMVRGEYERAAVKYQTALNEAPNEITIRYALAVALSYTTRRDETIQQFKIVASRGEPSSPEVRAAREWLASANELADPSRPITPSLGEAPGRAAQLGRVLGRIQWHNIDFRNLPPGAYRLVAEAGGTAMWDVPIDITADHDTSLDLTEANSTAPTDFDPPSG